MTLDRSLAGPDHAASLEPGAFGRYVRAARRGEQLARQYGEYQRKIDVVAARGTKLVLPCERDVRTVSRQSIVTVRALSAGEVVTKADVTFKRPGTGLAPFRVDEVIGRGLLRAVEGDVPLMGEDVGVPVAERAG